MTGDDNNSTTTDDAATHRSIVEHCTRLRAQLTTDAVDLQAWRGDPQLIVEGSARLQGMLKNVDELLGRAAVGCGGGMERDEH